MSGRTFHMTTTGSSGTAAFLVFVPDNRHCVSALLYDRSPVIRHRCISGVRT